MPHGNKHAKPKQKYTSQAYVTTKQYIIKILCIPASMSFFDSQVRPTAVAVFCLQIHLH